jgi:PST family polysaccharide transporter
MTYLKSDVALLGWLQGKEAAGVYAPAAMIINALFLFPSVIYAVFLPLLSKLDAVSDKRKFRSLSIYGLIVFGILGLGLTGLTNRMGDLLIALIYGPGFESAAASLRILSLLLFFKSLSFGLAGILIAKGWQDRRLIVQGLAAAVNLGTNLLVIPTYGVSGAAWAYVASEVFLMVGYGWLVHLKAQK